MPLVHLFWRLLYPVQSRAQSTIHSPHNSIWWFYRIVLSCLSVCHLQCRVKLSISMSLTPQVSQSAVYPPRRNSSRAMTHTTNLVMTLTSANLFVMKTRTLGTARLSTPFIFTDCPEILGCSEPDTWIGKIDQRGFTICHQLFRVEWDKLQVSDISFCFTTAFSFSIERIVRYYYIAYISYIYIIL